MAVVWTNKKPINKTTYNIGNAIVSKDNPVWDMNGQTGIPITARHDPCGYWYGKEAAPSQATRKNYGQLYGAGNNSSYQLGFGTAYQYQQTFLQTGGDKFFIKAVTSSNNNQHSFALSSDHTLWCVGNNGAGQLGLGDLVERQVWTQVPGLWQDIAISPYYAFSVGVKIDGTMWSTGYNNYGQLGLNDEVDRNIFTQVGTSTKWRKVDCGSFYTMAINDDGNLFATGDSYQGATGLGYGAGKEKEFTYVSTVAGVDRVSCGYYTTAILKTDGSLWVTGSNNDGQFGLGNTTARTTFGNVAAAGSGIIDFCMGWNNNTAYGGVLFIIKSDRTLWAAGSNLNNIMGIAGDDLSDKLNFVQLAGTGWDKIHSKDTSVLGIKTDGTMWGCGKNNYSELGLGDLVARTSFEQIGTGLWQSVHTDRSSMAINWDGTYYWE